MFVKANTLREIRAYFQQELQHLYSENELKIILRTLYEKRFGTTGNFLLAQEDRLSESDLLFFHNALKRLRANEPFQYVVGETEFYGLTLKTDARALIPRPETEELVDWVLNESRPSKVLDLCAGSGCIALALKSKLPEAQIVAVEWSEAALKLIEENRQATKLDLAVVHADVLVASYMDFTGEEVDVIVSNPPYIPLMDKERMEANVLDFEPEMALFVEDDDPLIFYREIIARSKAVLQQEGWIYFEIHEDLAKGVVSLFEENGFVNIEVRKDLQGKERMVRAQVLSFAP